MIPFILSIFNKNTLDLEKKIKNLEDLTSFLLKRSSELEKQQIEIMKGLSEHLQKDVVTEKEIFKYIKKVNSVLEEAGLITLKGKEEKKETIH